jgi:hypothetical protein
MNRIRAKIRYHEAMPRFHGVAYEDFMNRSLVTYIFPVNHVVSLCWRIWRRVRHAPYQDAVRRDVYDEVLRHINAKLEDL